MFAHYLKIAVRSALRQKGYALINIIGLALGIAVSICIMLYVKYELSYDKFHQHYDRIYRLSLRANFGHDPIDAAVVSPPMGPYIVRNFPEAELFTRFYKSPGSGYFRYDEKKYYESNLLWADSAFFQIFSFELIRGNPDEALKHPNSLVLTETAARRYFGDEDAMGKTLVQNDAKNYTITGIVKDPPPNSHFGFEMIGSFVDLTNDFGAAYFENWGAFSLHTYLLLAEDADPAALQVRFPEMIKTNMQRISEQNYKVEPYLQKLGDIYLHSKLMREIEPTGNVTNVIIFSAIALFILLIACINFMNLATARAFARSREVALRKVHGAVRKQLVAQFIGESLLYAMVAMVLALLLVELFLPVFSGIVNKELAIVIPDAATIIPVLSLVVLITGFLAGSYPAFYLSSFNPLMVFKSTQQAGRRGIGFRNVLVVFQFGISIFLIISSMIIYNQLNYVKTKNLGFDTERTILIPMNGSRQRAKMETYKKEFANLSQVVSAARSRHAPGRGLEGNSFIPEGMDEKTPWLIYFLAVEPEFVGTLGIDVIMGRDFSHEYATDSSAVIINETLYKKLGWENPMGRKLKIISEGEPRDYHIIGVIADFHAQSLHQGIEPMLLTWSPRHYYLNLRLGPGDIHQSLRQVEEKWVSMEPDVPFMYEFVDQAFHATYKADLMTGKLFVFFTALAIAIACMGLLGLTAFMTGRRYREIGIRKVLGAPVAGIMLTLSSDYSKWVLIANIIAWPAAWIIMSRWLENFAYRTEISIVLFVLAGLITLLIAWITIGWQTIRAATANPVEAIKYE
jgi:putative ABC transport system permease protein